MTVEHETNEGAIEILSPVFASSAEMFNNTVGGGITVNVASFDEAWDESPVPPNGAIST